MLYQPPKTIQEVLYHIDFDQPLELNDPRFVETQAARGSEKTLRRLAVKLGLDLTSGNFTPATKSHVLLFGHTGSGKTTQLRHYAETLSGPGRYLAVEVDVALQLDLHNVQYADVLMALARALLTSLSTRNIAISGDAIKPLEDWFAERVLGMEEASELSADVKSQAKIGGGIPGLLSLFTSFTAAFKTNATYKDSFRRVIRNNFAQFAEAFNIFLASAEAQLAATNQAKRILFIVDGTDKLRTEDRAAFFVQDVEQLLAINAHVVYTAPLSLKYEGNLTSKLDADLILPMIKLDNQDGSPFQPGLNAMHDILLKRADHALFASQQIITEIVRCSGGHPRELLRLLKLCCEYAEGTKFTVEDVASAVKQLASEYRRFLEPADYGVLVAVDKSTIHIGNDERTRKLLYNLALLEYNDGSWQRSHPVVRTLDGYKHPPAAATTAMQPAVS